jgi:UDP-glucose 4-epimerase
MGKWFMKRVFITGVAGFLGSHLAKKMHQLGWSVSGNDNFMGSDRSNLLPFVRFFEIDCCNLQDMRNAIEDCDLLFHCAATAHEGLSVFSPTFITRNNYEASISTFTAAINANVRRIIFCSSMARYGDQNAPFNELMQPTPVDPYGIAKVAAEETLKVLAQVHEFEWNIAVPHNIVGEGQKYDDPYRNVMSIMLNRNLQGLPSIIYGDGEQTRCFSYIDDCIDCLVQMGIDPNINEETINIGPDEEVITINALASLCANETGLNRQPIYHLSGRPQEVKHATCSSDKARKLLNYETKTTVAEAVKKTADFIRKSGIKKFTYHIPLEIINQKTPQTWTEKSI